MSDEQNPDIRISRVIDFRIPLPWLLSGLIVVLWALISMYFALNQLVREMGDLQITVKAGNTSSATLSGEQVLLRFRLENVESEMRVLRDIREDKAGRSKP